MKHIFLLLIFSILLCADNNASFKNISFSGNNSFLATSLKEALGIEERSFYRFWEKQKEFSQDEIKDISEEIVEFYNSKGFFKAEVKTLTSKDSAVFEITENKHTTVGSILINSTLNLDNMIVLKLGERFDADAFVKSKENIKKYLNENAFAKAKFDAKAYIDPDNYQARLEFNTTNIRESNFGAINISTLENIDASHIKDKLAFQSGQRYDSRKIDESYKNLYAIGVFDSVSIRPILDENIDDTPIDVNLTLGKQRSFKLGLGYDTDEGIRLKGGWLHRNFLGNLNRLEAMTELSGVRQAAGAKITIPRLFGFEFEDLLKYENVHYSGYSEKIASNIFKFKIPQKTTTHSFGLQTEVGGVEADNESEQIKNDSFVINSLIYEYVIDKRDSILDAKNGYYIGWNVEFSDYMLGSSLNYLKTNFEARRIFSYAENTILKNFLFAAKANIGVINDFKKNNIPIFKRFFAGGSFSNRGYSYRRLGEQDASGAYIGGNTLIDYSLEARYKTTKSLWSVLFFDSTLLNEKSLIFNGEYKPSIGIGLRYDTIIGPVRADIGVPLREKDKSPVFHISFGQVF